MARQRNPDRDRSQQMWLESRGQLKLKDIAAALGIAENKVRKWKSLDRWEDVLKGSAPLESKGSVPHKGGAPPRNKNAVGNRGGAAPKGNSNAVTHGFFRKYLPEESLEIMGEIAALSPIDMLWDNITIQYTAIIRAQRIMYVRDQDDSTTTRIEEKSGAVDGERWEVQHAWDKQATFLAAQSRAMTTLQGMIKQYDELLRTDLATEEQRARIAALKAKVPDNSKQDLGKQITALADLINNPAPKRVIDDV